jgi:hypothetical protein
MDAGRIVADRADAGVSSNDSHNDTRSNLFDSGNFHGVAGE